MVAGTEEIGESPPRSLRPFNLAECGLIVIDPEAQHSGDADATRFGQCLQSCRNIDPIAEDVVLLDDHIAQINSDEESDPTV
jgi:hypothetical protein